MRRIALGALLVGMLANCGQTPNPSASGPTPSPTASPTITATPAPVPTPTSSPPDGMMLRGIPMLREIDGEAARYANALALKLDEREPGHTHTVVCTSVMFLWMSGAHTPCQVTTDTGAPVVWTALTQEHPDPPGGGPYIEFTVGKRTDVNPWPPNLPPVTPATPTS